MKDKIINKMNESKESDVALYNWQTIPESLKQFWTNYYESNTKI